MAAAEFGIAGENYYHAPRNPPYWQRIDGSIPDLLLRRGVAEKLARINERLAAADLELFLFDAWRPRAVQAYFHDVWMPAELHRARSVAGGAGADCARWNAIGPRRHPIRPRRRRTKPARPWI